MTRTFASAADTTEQIPELVELGPDVYGFISDYDPNTGVVIGDDACLIIDSRATPQLGREFLDAIRTVTDKPVKYLFLTHYHAVRAMGASAFPDLATIIASDGTRELIVERGEADLESETRRFPRLFRGVEEIPGLTWPTVTFSEELTLWLGSRKVEFLFMGRGHTKGDAICRVPDAGVIFAGDLVEHHCAVYAGDAYLREWCATLERLLTLDGAVLVPGRGAVLRSRPKIDRAIRDTRGFIDQLFITTRIARARFGDDLAAIYKHVHKTMSRDYGSWPIFEHCLPFDVSRAVDELSGIEDPLIWTADRDAHLWDLL